MITTLTQFDLPLPAETMGLKAGFLEVAPAFQQVPGLIRKAFLISEDGMTAGGCYLWKSREDASAFVEGTLRDMIREKFGVECRVTYFDSPVVVDNVTGEILTEA